jgi:aspartyl-tRNA(Asn)/glutamyl-tRNA(Gln) amidotransferase subunit A
VPNYLAELNDPIAGLKLGVARDWFETEARASDDTLAAFEKSLTTLQDLGASLRDVRLPPSQACSDAKITIAIAELFSIHAADLRSCPQLFGDRLRYRILSGGLIRAEDYLQATRWRRELAAAILSAFREVDVIVLPTISYPAGKLELTSHAALLTSETAYTVPFNVSGCPALSLCNGFSPSGMPLSLQFAGRPFEEQIVLRVANSYEKATPWRKHRPRIVKNGTA